MDQSIEQFKIITNIDDDNVAKFYLESAHGNLETAISNYYQSGGSSSNLMHDDDDQTMHTSFTPISSTSNPSQGRTLGSTSGGLSSAPPKSTDQPVYSSSKKSTTTSSGGKKFASLRDLQSDEQPSNPKDNRYYAGGSRNSGQQIIGANDDDEDEDDEENHFADKIFKSAQKQGAKSASEYEDEVRRNQPKFAGSGRRLGNTDNASTVIPGEKKPEEKVVTIVFWSDGFTVDDGELRPYDAPENREFLQSIDKGIAPRELYTSGADIVVNLLNKKTEKWSEQPKQFKAFVGSGRSLATTSSSASSSSSSSSSVVSTPSNYKFELDPNKPTTTLQIRLADGGRLVGKFNLTHTVRDIKEYIKSQKPSSAAFDIMTQFPNKVLTEENSTIEEAGLKGATIIQKLK
ncbi:hypothetical protein C9374_004533 [Naegleria lovaniensis]|uniref:UBX domain-containing protein n=1 Tax=Naegleria lovaniensis TaxID=51637 RepID=A0AA88KP14_NAELO|nr:uncharacterized protein C9374_004533 [Naegleria lovaniensis]KAG2383196.1 hypothetical protein C9374_004533 [Naegleria lovaniensis]